MKKIIYLILLLTPLLTFSQEKEISKEEFRQKDKLFKGYAVAGVNFNQIDGDKSAGYNILGANVGIGTFITYTDKFSNSIEISYSMRGAKSGINLRNSHPQYFWYQMDYIEIPLMFNYHDFKIAIFQAGFSFNHVIRTDFKSGYSQAFVDHYNWNFDLVVGATFLLKKHWGINFKYNYSILNNLKNGPKRGNLISQPSIVSSNSSGNLNWYHNVLTFRAMYIF